MKTNKNPDAAALRRLAEERLGERQRGQKSEVRGQRSSEDTARLVHELQVHQIELEMQNEELQQARAKADALLAQHADLYDFASTGYLTLDREGTIRQVNLTGALLLGVERSKLDNRRFGQFVAEGDRRVFSDFLEKVFASEAKVSREVTLPKEGSQPLVVWIEGKRSEDGQECHAVVLNITERKKMELELVQKNNARSKLNKYALELSNMSSGSNLQALIANQVKDIACADVAVFSEYDSSTRTTTTKHIAMDSGLLEKVVGLLGKKVHDIHSVVSDEMYREMTTEMIGIKKTLYEASFGAIPRSVGAAIQTLLKVDRIIGIAYLIEGKLYGTSILLMGKGQPDPPREILEYFVHLAASSLRRKRAEEALRESEQRFMDVLYSSSDAVLLIDGNKFIDCNEATARMLRYSHRNEFLNAHPSELSPPVQPDGRNSLEKANEMMRTALERGFHQFEWEHRRADGEVFPVEVSLTSIVLYQKNVIHCMWRDITERKRAESELKQSIQSLRDSLTGTIQALDAVVESRDPYTAGHQRRVAGLAQAIASEMSLPTHQIEGLGIAANIHDLGKIAVPAEILSKPTKLTKFEFELMKNHPQAGYEILKNIVFPWPIARIILEHHEKMDGSGYPHGLVGEKTLLESRIISVADVVEAMASHRPYRPALGIDAALEEIEKNKGLLYDADVVAACLALFREKRFRFEVNPVAESRWSPFSVSVCKRNGFFLSTAGSGSTPAAAPGS